MKAHYIFDKNSNSGNLVFRYKLIIGEKITEQYRLMEWVTEFKFMEFADGGWLVKFTNKDFVQHAQCRDFKNGLGKYLVEMIESGFKANFFDVMM